MKGLYVYLQLKDGFPIKSGGRIRGLGDDKKA